MSPLSLHKTNTGSETCLSSPEPLTVQKKKVTYIPPNSLFQFALPDPSYQPTVDAFAVPARRAYAAGGGNPNLEVYVNYAHGDEGVNAWYSPRKLGRLRGLKNRWDPHNLFSFTNGINPPRRN